MDQAEIYRHLRNLCIFPKHRGCRYLVYAISLVIRDEDYLRNVTKVLYPLVAKCCDTTPACVEYNMRRVIGISWASEEGRAYLCQLAKRDLTRKPTNRDFIDIVSNYIRRNEEAEALHFV